MNINWKQKLSSRKFWAGTASFAASALAAFNVDSLTQGQVTVIITGIGALCVYMLAETVTDTARAKAESDKPE